MSLIRGKVNEIALQHDASRVVQAAIQFGSKEQRKELLKEICVVDQKQQKDATAKDEQQWFCWWISRISQNSICTFLLFEIYQILFR